MVSHNKERSFDFVMRREKTASNRNRRITSLRMKVRAGSSLYDCRDVAPFAREDKRGNGLALPLAGLVIAQSAFGQCHRIARVADREAGDRFVVWRNAENLARLIWQDPGHLVGLETKRCCLQGQRRGRLADIVERMTILRAVVRHFVLG